MQNTSTTSAGTECLASDDTAGGAPDIPGKTYKESAGDSTSGAGAQTGSSDSDTAPSYVTNLATQKTGKPKGKNITEGGFDDSSANASLPEPGSEDDPGRASLQGFQNQQAAIVRSGPRQEGITGNN